MTPLKLSEVSVKFDSIYNIVLVSHITRANSIKKYIIKKKLTYRKYHGQRFTLDLFVPHDLRSRHVSPM